MATKKAEQKSDESEPSVKDFGRHPLQDAFDELNPEAEKDDSAESKS